MTEKEKAEIKKIEMETTAIKHGIYLKWYAAITATIIGGTPLIDFIKDFFK